MSPQQTSGSSHGSCYSLIARRLAKATSDLRFAKASALPLPVYRDFVDMLFSMRLPIFGLGFVFICVCILASVKLDDARYMVLAALGLVTTFWRIKQLRGYAGVSPVADLGNLKRWERQYAIGNYASAALLATLNVLALTEHNPLLHLITVSLVFSFGAGVVARISIRPKICIVSVLLATIPTAVALAVHSSSLHLNSLHTEMFLIEALLVAMITALSLQTVAHLYRSAVEHHTIRHDLAQLAKYDPLTGLPNRLLLRERFQASVAGGTQHRHLLALHFLDLDGFKAINDLRGHPAGDALLEQVAHRLEAIVRTSDTVARLGGDEFVVLQSGLQHEDEAKLLAGRIIRRLSEPYTIGGNIMHISASIGIATSPQNGLTLEQMLSGADTALYRAKADGKARAVHCNVHDAPRVHIAA